MKINVFLLLFISFGFLHSQEVNYKYVDSLQMASRKEFKVDNPKATFETLDKLKAYSLKHNYQKGLFNVANYKGIFHTFLGSLDSSRAYYMEALQIGKQNKFNKGLSKLLSNLGVLEDNSGNYNEAIKWYLESVKLSEILKDSILLGKNYGNLSVVYQRIDDRKLQEFYIKKGIEILPNDTFEKGILYTDLANLYKINKNFPAFLKTIKKTEAINTIIKSDRLSFFVDRYYGYYYLKKEEFKKALNYLKKAYSYTKKESYYYGIEMDLYMGQCYNELGNFKKSEFHLNKAIEGKNTYQIPFDLEIEILKTLAIVSNEQNPSDAYKILNEILVLNDSVYKTEKIELSKKLSVEFETEKKDKELAENALEIEKKKTQLFSIIGIAVFLLATCLVLFLIFRLNKQKHKVKIINLEKENELSKLEALLQGEDKERSRVAKDLHDGINGDLSAIKIQLSGLSTDNFSTKEAQIFGQSIDMIDNACEVIRNISHNLAPPAIKDFGWLEAVEKFCNKMNKNYKEEIIFQSYGNNIQFSETTQGHLYRITQELVYNTLKHAKASEVLVQINLNDISLILTVEDDGVGFDKTKNYEGIGLKNIESRVAYLDGKWKLEVDRNGTSNNLEFNINKLL